MLDRAEAAQILQIVDIDVPVIDFVAALAQEVSDHVLAWPFGTPGRGYCDKIPGGRELGVETGFDGIEDLLSAIDGVHFRHCFRCCFQNRKRGTTLREAKISRPRETRMPGNRNIMYLIIGALIVAVGVLGYNLYQTKKEPEGLQINLGPNGLKIQNK
jgi:hypothetical protein